MRPLPRFIKNQLQVRKSEKRKRTQMRDVGNAVHRDFERDRDSLLDLFRVELPGHRVIIST